MKRHLQILPAILLLGLIRNVVAGQAPHLAESPDIPISSHDRVYTADQTSNTVSVYDPSSNRLLGVLRLGDVTPQNLSPLYRGQLLVHGLGFSFDHKTLAIVSIGSNSVTFLDTATNEIKHITYVGRAPHEPFFTPDGSELWVTVRGEDYVSVIDTMTYQEKARIQVAWQQSGVFKQVFTGLRNGVRQKRETDAVRDPRKFEGAD